MTESPIKIQSDVWTLFLSHNSQSSASFIFITNLINIHMKQMTC